MVGVGKAIFIKVNIDSLRFVHLQCKIHRNSLFSRLKTLPDWVSLLLCNHHALE